jgi:hypothetical protein
MKRTLVQAIAVVSLTLGLQAAPILQENFQGASGSGIQTSAGVIPGTIFSLISGSIDINTGADYGWLCVAPASGICVDTTGSTATQPGRGVFETTNAINLSPGSYLLSFSLVRWNDTQNGGGLQDASITVTLGSLYNETFNVDGTWTNQTINRIINVASGTSVYLRFTDNSGSAPYAGAIVDNVLLDAVPEPATYGMIGLGLSALALVRRKRS